MRVLKIAAALFVLVLLYLLLWPTGMEPKAWTPPPAPGLDGVYARNDKLKGIQRLASGIGVGPEGISVDAAGRLYAGYEDGRVVQFSPNGSVYTVLAQTHGRPLGIALGPNGGLAIADARKGLLHFGDRLKTWASVAQDVPFGFTDDVDSARLSKTVYFSDASSRFGYGHEVTDLLEHGGNGRLLQYDLTSRQTRVLLDGLHFANGVAVGPGDEYVLVNETGEYRILRYWLKGEKAGTHDVFIDNLPGFPDNLSFNGKDRFWVAIFAPRDPLLDQLLPGYFFARQLVARLPRILQPRPAHMAFVLGLDLRGQVVANLQYEGADAYAPITSVREYGPWLYFGSLKYPALGRLPLNQALEGATPPPVGWENLPPSQMRLRTKSQEQIREEQERGQKEPDENEDEDGEDLKK